MQKYRVELIASRPKQPQLGRFPVIVDVEAPNRAVAERLARKQGWSQGILFMNKATVKQL